METTFTVPSISCSICSNRIKTELGGMEGIEGIDVDLKAQTVKVAYDPAQHQPKDIRGKIAEMGYEVLQ
ncbi:MAG: heavy metal-associated domain-containing protein [Clostridiaceae bacterium]